MLGFAHFSSPFLKRNSSWKVPLSCPRCCSPADAPAISRRALLSLAYSAALFSASPSPGKASAEPDAIGHAYDTYSASYDFLDGSSSALPRALGFSDMRAAAVARASGRTLEVGCGTGANFPLYSNAPLVRTVTGMDISDGMLAIARQRADSMQAIWPAPKFELLRCDVASMPLAWEAGFDTVIDTFSLCVMPDPGAALREIRRVVKPNGRVFLLEHNVSDSSLLAAYQNLTAVPVAKISKGCFWNQDVVGLAESAGLRVRSLRKDLLGTVISLELCRDDAMKTAK